MFPIIALGLFLAACSTPAPQEIPPGHLSQGMATRIPNTEIAVAAAAELADPVPAAPPSPTFSITVRRVPVRDLLFALARDAGLEIDIDDAVDGLVTLNAVDQPMDAILARIAAQTALRYEFSADLLRILPDRPYLQHYPVNYIHLARKVSGAVSASTLISNGNSTASGAGNTSQTRIENVSGNHFWEQLEKNLLGILAQDSAPGGKDTTAAPSLLTSPETGLVTVFARQRTQRKLADYLARLSKAAQRQVMIEATIVEVALSEGHEQGIDWSGLLGSGLVEFAGNQLKGAVNLRYNRNDNPAALISLLQRFGSTRVLSTPRLSVLNNQTALLKVVENYVYFTVRADSTSTANVGTTVTYTTTPQTVPVGLVMGITPQISENGQIVLNVRPTITSIGREVADPNPDLRKYGIENLVPMIRTREIESVMRIADGQIAVLGGLMEDRADYRTARPPILGELPLVGEAFNNRANRVDKTELVIFLRPVVVHSPSMDGDYASLAGHLPDNAFLRPPRHARPFHNFPAPGEP